MLILHIVAPAAFGGLERVVQALVTGFRKRGHDVHVAAVLAASSDAATHPFIAAVRGAGAEVHPVGVATRAYLRERSAIDSLCRRLEPDVVHTHGYRPDVVDAGVARRAGVATVTTVHGFTGGGWKNRLYERVQRAAFRRFDAVVAVSRPLAESLRESGVRAERLHLVQNAWRQATPLLDREAARRALGVGDDRFHVGWVGRLGREKGPDVLVDAVAQLPDLSLTVSLVGEGREQTALRARAEHWGVTERVLWHGAVPDAQRLFSGFDAFVLSSRTEGTPIVLFEAMAAGVPIVATSVGGVPDVLSPAEALLVPPDDPAALAAAIREVRRDPRRATMRAQAARARLAREFAVAPWLERYEAIYHEARRTAGHGRRSA